MKGDGLGSLLVYHVNSSKTLLQNNLLYNITGEQDHRWNMVQLTLSGSKQPMMVSKTFLVRIQVVQMQLKFAVYCFY